MKKFAAALFITCMASCSGMIESPNSGRLRIKVSEISDSEGIEKMDIYVFNEVGALETMSTFELGKNAKNTEADIAVRTGAKDIHVLANMETSLGGITTVSDLMSGRISMGERGFDGGLLPMGGHISGVTVFHDKRNTCSISLRRFPSRVQIGTISNEMECSLSDIRFRLSNAAGDCGVSDESTPTLWFNKIYSLGSDIQAPDDVILRGDIPGGEKLTVDQCLFCFPNHTVNDSFSGKRFTPRKTRLVMSGSISGKTYYYPITFDSIDRNTSYNVNIVIRNPGSEDPDIPISNRDLSATIVPLSWSGPFKIEESL